MANSRTSAEQAIKDRQDWADRFSEHGVAGIFEYVNSKKDEWKNVKIRIAVVGRSGCGKSHTINTLRGLSQDDAESAPSFPGAKPTTAAMKEYPDPRHPLIVYCDAPGLGVTINPSTSDLLPAQAPGEHLKTHNIESCDFFIILTKDRFTNEDGILAQHIKDRLKKKYAMVRTFVDVDVANYRRHPKTKSLETEEIKTSIHKDIQDTLGSFHLDNDRIFLIDNWNPTNQDYDFDSLMNCILEGLNQNQREAMILAMRPICRTVIKKKAEVLRNRVWRSSSVSALVAVVPIPGTSILADIALLDSEDKKYRHDFGIDDESIKRLQQMLANKTDPKTLEILAAVSPYAAAFTSRVVACVSILTIEDAVEEAAKYIPVVGSIMGGILSYASLNFALRRMITKYETTALKITDYVAENALGGIYLNI